MSWTRRARFAGLSGEDQTSNTVARIKGDQKRMADDARQIGNIRTRKHTLSLQSLSVLCWRLVRLRIEGSSGGKRHKLSRAIVTASIFQEGFNIVDVKVLFQV